MLGEFSKRKRLRTHWFLKRSSTDKWRNVLKARRRKWRYELTVSYPKRFKAIKWKARLHIIGNVWIAKKSPFDGKWNYTR